MKQGSDEWKALRKTKVGSSDAAVIMGCGYMPLHELWEIKTNRRPEPEMNAAMEHGQRSEEDARRFFERERGCFVLPDVVFSPERPWQMASLDGVSPDKSLYVEIKCPFTYDRYNKLKETKTPPDYYYAQCQHQMAVTGAPSVVLYFWFRNGFDEEGFSMLIARDDAYISRLNELEEAFWQSVMNDTPPTNLLTDEETERLELEYLALLDTISSLEEKKEEIRKRFEERCVEEKSYGKHLSFVRSKSLGSINYKEIPELKNIDLEKYRNPETVRFTIRVRK